MVFGMLAVGVLFMGEFAVFTYLRPFLERVTQVDVSTLSMLLLLIGVFGLVGTVFVGHLLTWSLRTVLVVTPVLMAAMVVVLLAAGRSLPATAVLLAVWGLVSTSAPVAWFTWLAKTLPQDAEAGGGLMVAIIQLAITLGASVGGLLFDHQGYQLTFLAGAGLLAVSAALSIAAGQFGRRTLSIN
ncbi:MFS transporter [Roseateles sp. BYS96W]|uniref:MFS transporter n=1 Tax=Pelomonas nitida TaxID=3299027 RepID=UPI0037495741